MAFLFISIFLLISVISLCFGSDLQLTEVISEDVEVPDDVPLDDLDVELHQFFFSEEEMHQKYRDSLRPHRCKIQHPTGSGLVQSRRWYYDVTSDECRSFSFHGASRELTNNFRSLRECNEICLTGLDSIIEQSTSEDGPVARSSGCEANVESDRSSCCVTCVENYDGPLVSEDMHIYYPLSVRSDGIRKQQYIPSATCGTQINEGCGASCDLVYTDRLVFVGPQRMWKTFSFPSYCKCVPYTMTPSSSTIRSALISNMGTIAMLALMLNLVVSCCCVWHCRRKHPMKQDKCPTDSSICKEEEDPTSEENPPDDFQSGCTDKTQEDNSDSGKGSTASEHSDSRSSCSSDVAINMPQIEPEPKT